MDGKCDAKARANNLSIPAYKTSAATITSYTFVMFLSGGIKKVVAKSRYHAAQETRDMFSQAGVDMRVLEDQIESYENQ